MSAIRPQGFWRLSCRGRRVQEPRSQPVRHTFNMHVVHPTHRSQNIAISYNEMVLESDRISSCVSVCAAVCSWWSMAGFLVLPGAFISLEKIQDPPSAAWHNAAHPTRSSLSCCILFRFGRQWCLLPLETFSTQQCLAFKPVNDVSAFSSRIVGC